MTNRYGFATQHLSTRSAKGGGINVSRPMPTWVYSFKAKDGKTFEESLRVREFEPDGPNYTPRISGIVQRNGGAFSYSLSILKSNQGDPEECLRFTFDYSNPKAGEGHFIHTYMGDGSPLPSYEGEPQPVELEGDIDTFTSRLWENLNEDNKVSLFVRYLDPATGETETRIVNKNA